MEKATLKLKTAEERAAEVRVEAEAFEAEQAAKKAEKAASPKVDAPKSDEPPEPNYAQLAKAEEARAAQLREDVDALQLEIDPSLRKRTPTETKPHVILTELLNKHDNAQDTLDALHNAIRTMREEPGLNEVKEVAWPEDLSHLTPAQREKTLGEMEAGRRRSEAASDQQKKVNEIRRTQSAKEEMAKVELAKLREQLADAERTIQVLRHNPSTTEVFPTIALDKVRSNGAA